MAAEDGRVDDGHAHLDRITDPAGRILNVTVSSSGQLTSAVDPDGENVVYRYDGQSRLTRRLNRRGDSTMFYYNNQLRVTSVQAPLSSQTDLGVTSFSHWDEVGLSIGQVGGTQTAKDPALVYTEIDGARLPSDVQDLTRIWVDRWGAPTKIRDALGFETILTRGNPVVPALVTQVQAPNNFITQATYDARGNILTSTAVNPYGATQGNAVTTYEWHPIWDFVTEITQAEGETLTFGYDAPTGNRIWQEDGRGISSRVTFNYAHPYKLLSAVVRPGGAVDSIRYGPALGNPAWSWTALGFRTSHQQDAIGRDTLVYTPIDGTRWQRQRTIYDAMNRVMAQHSMGPAMSGVPAESVLVQQSYDEEGNVESVTRWSAPNSAGIGQMVTQWRYDLANRAVKEIASDGMSDSTVYDRAGNPIQVLTRRGHSITMMYDELNRLETRTLSAVSYPSRPTNFSITSPRTIPDYAPYTIPAETHSFTYDSNGRLRTADNLNAKVKRTYYANGQIETDSSWIQTVARDNWNQHKYGLRYTYDLNGRRTTLAIPQQLAIGTGTTASSTYNSITGAPESITDVQGNTYDFGYNARDELVSIEYPGSYDREFSYDPEGRLIADTIWNSGGTAYPRLGVNPVRAARFQYDAGGRLLWSGDAAQYRDTMQVTYTGLGRLRRSQFIQHGSFSGCAGTACTWESPARATTVETYAADALSNIVERVMVDTITTSGGLDSIFASPQTPTYEPSTGRQLTEQGGNQTYFYDDAGNIDFYAYVGSPTRERASFFAADGSLRALEHRWAQGASGGIGNEQRYGYEEYRYDALGRRIWVKSEQWCNDVILNVNEATECRTSLLRRTIWDGDQELAEIQMPWGLQTSGYTVSTTPSWWENDTAPVSLGTIPTHSGGAGDPNPYFGHVIYAGFQGIDQPLSVTRVHYVMALDIVSRVPDYRVKTPFSIMPFWSARGEAPIGAFSNGAKLLCDPPNSQTACVGVMWAWNFSAYNRKRGLARDTWHGSLLESKRDKSGLGYHRNRYYAPATGRFTQEDPIGLAGGLNLYGFAGGDPVNFSDPFGLCKEGADDDCQEIVRQLRAVGGTIFNAAADFYEHGNFAVHLVAGNDSRLEAGYGPLNHDEDPATHIWGNAGRSGGDPVYLNAEMDLGDRMWGAAHEALVHVSGNRLASAMIESLGSASGGDPFLTTNRAIFRALPDDLQQAAPAAAYAHFFSRGLSVPSFGYVSLDALIAGICARERC